jgi:ATP-binding cassette subfamily C protein CydCD
MAVCVGVGILAAVVGIVRLALLGWLIGQIYRGASPQELIPAFAMVGVIMLARGALEHWRAMTAHHTAARIQTALRDQLHAHLCALGPSYFGMERTGEVMLALVEGVEQLEVWFGEYLPQLCIAGLVPAIVFALLAPFDWMLATILLVFAWLTLFAPAVFHRWDMANSLRRSKAYAAFGAEFLDSLQGLATLKAFGQSAARGRVLAEKAEAVFRSTMWVLATNSLTRGITDTGLALGAATALGVGAWRVQAGTLDLTTLLMVLMAGIEVFRPQRDLRSLLHNGMMGMSAAQSIFKVLDATPVVREPTASSAAVQQPSVEFDTVRFSYPGSHQSTHDGLSFRIRPGEQVAFVGASGAGKTTIVKLLLRFHDPNAGDIRLGGVALRGLPASQRTDLIAVVSQDTFLFHGTVADNLRLGLPEASLYAMQQAAQDANALEFIETLPEGFETVIGERGIRLSGGQRQRIAIARALLCDAPILVLDEALSSVDAENEAVIQQALERLMVGRTTLVFAHRLSSVKNANRILVLDAGKVVEEGTHAELVSKRGRYLQLMQEQINVAGDHLSSDEHAIELPDPDLAHNASENKVPETVELGIVKTGNAGWGALLLELLRYASPWRAKLALTFVFGITRVLALIGVGVLSALVVAAVRNDEPFSDYLWWLAFAAPTAGIVHWLESWVAHDMAFRMLAQMRVQLFRKLDELAPAYLTRRRSGDLVAMATHDVEMVEYFFAHTIAPAAVALLVPGAVLLTLGAFSPALALALLPFLLLVSVTPLLLRKRLDYLGSKDREALGELNAHVVDTIQGIAEVSAFGRQKERQAQFMRKAAQHIAARVPFYADLSKQHALLEIATGLGGLAVVVTGSVLISDGFDPTYLPLLTLLALAAFLPVSEIAQIGRQLADTMGATRRLRQVRAEVPVVQPPVTPYAIDAEHDIALRLDQVTFSYPGTRFPALNDVSLNIPAGQSVALVGPSGAGKSTIAQLCLRFWDAGDGSIELFGTSIKALEPDQLRDYIALVSQDTYLFNDTLGANILLARPDASADELASALQNASLEDLVAQLPEGLDTRVGERGMLLSGGQRQRVAIARAFLKDAPILILDEATSHLDAVNEQAVHTALSRLMRSRTTVVIAHRLATIRQCDQIAVLSQGQIVEQGEHDTLVKAGGLYAHLCARQAASAA